RQPLPSPPPVLACLLCRTSRRGSAAGMDVSGSGPCSRQEQQDEDMPMKPSLVACCIAALSLALATPAHAELGDYSFWKTLLNLTAPPPADNKVTPEQASGPYPLLNNPGGFDSGFRPASYYAWQTVQLAPQTGAVCGNGSPYKFFVNRVPNT